MARRLIVGCGYLGRRVAEQWHAAGDTVWALTRSPERAAEWQQQGWHPLVGDITQPETLLEFPVVDTVLYAVGFDRSAGNTQRAVYVDGLQNVFTRLPGRYQRLLYISSTSVYGQSQGEWVDEDSPCQPTRPNGQVCLEAEQLLQQAPSAGNSPPVILRCSGLYGPGRLLSRIEAIRTGTPLPGQPDAWLNLLHIQDAVRAVLLAADCEQLRPLYLLTDDRPITRRTYYESLTRLVGGPPPTFQGGDETDLHKRCSNATARRELNWNLLFPTIKTGLPQACGLT